MSNFFFSTTFKIFPSKFIFNIQINDNKYYSSFTLSIKVHKYCLWKSQSILKYALEVVWKLISHVNESVM